MNGLAARARRAAARRTDLGAWAAAVPSLRSELVAVSARHGFAAEPSEANWVLVPGLARHRGALARAGVLVRDCASFGLPGTARVAVPDEDGRGRLDRALGALR